MAEIRFVGDEFDGAERELHGLADKLVDIANDVAVNRLGDSALMDPTDIEVRPDFFEVPKFFVVAWHESSGDTQRGRLQVHDFVLVPRLSGEDFCLTTEDGHEYIVTTREAFVLLGLANVAIMNAMLST